MCTVTYCLLDGVSVWLPCFMMYVHCARVIMDLIKDTGQNMVVLDMSVLLDIFHGIYEFSKIISCDDSIISLS